jgi:hypothetical protein
MWSAAHESAAEQPDDAPFDRFTGAAARMVAQRAVGHQDSGPTVSQAPKQGRKRARVGPAGDGHDLRVGRRERGVDAPSDLAPALAIDILERA